MSCCALVGASDFNSEHFMELDAQGQFDYVIAVDGGFAHLESIGRKADMALGDFDSLGYTPKGIRMAKFSSKKDKSDMELALDRAKAQRFDVVYVYGALGGRLDHTMANLQLMAKFCEQGMYVNAVGMNELVMYVTGPDMLELPAYDDGTVSVFSLSDQSTGVFERGLLYELDDAVITNRTSLGLSNEFVGEPSVVGVESGTLAVMVALS
ncbi:MAG: thiamine diphosphokinase [Eggerthellaceae bacterium]|nr:thiamine diphosphokinase [Eggerthellaceae bacterium]